MQGDVVEIPFLRFDFAAVFLAFIAQRQQVGVTVEGVVVEVDLAIETDELIVGSDHQWVDLKQRQIFLHEQFGQAAGQFAELFKRLAFETQAKGQLTALVGQQPQHRVDHHLQDLFGSLVCDLFDLHAAFGGGHHHQSLA